MTIQLSDEFGHVNISHYDIKVLGDAGGGDCSITVNALTWLTQTVKFHKDTALT